MKKLMLIAIVCMFAVSAFAQAPRPNPRGPSRNPGRVERREPPRHGGMSDDLAKAVGITHLVRDSIDIIFGRPNPPPRVIVRPAPIVTTPPVIEKTVIVTSGNVATPVVTTTPVIKEVVVEKPVVVEKEIKNIEPVIVSDKIYWKVTYTNGTIKFVEK